MATRIRVKEKESACTCTSGKICRAAWKQAQGLCFMYTRGTVVPPGWPSEGTTCSCTNKVHRVHGGAPQQHARWQRQRLHEYTCVVVSHLFCRLLESCSEHLRSLVEGCCIYTFRCTVDCYGCTVEAFMKHGGNTAVYSDNHLHKEDHCCSDGKSVQGNSRREKEREKKRAHIAEILGCNRTGLIFLEFWAKPCLVGHTSHPCPPLPK